MDVHYFLDPDTGQPHIYGHGVTEAEVQDVLRGPGEDLPAARNSRMKLGRTAGGRYLQVVYVPDEIPDSVFVITAYELRGKAKRPTAVAYGGSLDDRAALPAWLG